MDLLCRLCMEEMMEDEEKINIFQSASKTDAKKCYIDLIIEFFNLPLEMNTHLPSNVCEDCIRILDGANGLRTRIGESQIQFKELARKLEEKRMEHLNAPTEDAMELVEIQIVVSGEPEEVQIDSDSLNKSAPVDVRFSTEKTVKYIEKDKEIIEKAPKAPQLNKRKNLSGRTPYIVVQALEKSDKDVSTEKKRHEYPSIVGRETKQQKMRLTLENKMREMNLLNCIFCKRQFNYFKHLADHLEHRHAVAPGKGYIYCCNRKFTRRNAHDHMKFHINETVFKCDLCDKSFKTSCTFEAHRNHVHFGKTKNHYFPCDECNEIFPSRTQLSLHTRAGHRPKNSGDLKGVEGEENCSKAATLDQTNLGSSDRKSEITGEECPTKNSPTNPMNSKEETEIKGLKRNSENTLDDSLPRKGLINKRKR